jgi:1-acyl-sn-glycerol-3-phosphate acyltransferase
MAAGVRTLFVGFLICVGVLFGLPWLLLWTLLTGRPDFMYKISMRFLRAAVRLAGVRVRIEGIENVPPTASILAANHASNLDPLALLPVLPRRVTIFAKQELFRIPIFSAGMRLAGFIPVERGSREAAAGVGVAVERLREGLSLAIFPEGTRSPDGRLRPFKRGAFAIAIEAGVPVVPVSIGGAHRALRRGSWIVQPGEVTVRFGAAIEAADYTTKTRSALLAEVQSRVASGLPPDQQPDESEPGQRE